MWIRLSITLALSASAILAQSRCHDGVQVVDPLLSPIPNATVAVSRLDVKAGSPAWSSSLSITTGKDGRACLPDGPATFQYRISAEGFGKKEGLVKAGGVVVVPVEVARVTDPHRYSIRGTVKLHNKTNEPRWAVFSHLLGTDSRATPLSSDGTFRIEAEFFGPSQLTIVSATGILACLNLPGTGGHDRVVEITESSKCP
jgi:hypothetical protein